MSAAARSTFSSSLPSAPAKSSTRESWSSASGPTSMSTRAACASTSRRCARRSATPASRPVMSSTCPAAAIALSPRSLKQPRRPLRPPAEIAPPRSLPAQLTKMVGREEVIEKISNGLSLYRFMTVVGPGGIGKTVVAVTVGHRRSADFGGRVFFVDFGPLRDASHIATTIASALGLTISAEDPTPALLTFLKTGPALLIFDSCEHVLDALAPLVERIVREAPQLRVLATSRELFRSEGERIFRLFPLDCPPEREGLAVDEVLAYPAAQLFVERIAQSSGPFQLSAEEAPLVASICRRLDGIALAIELAAGRVNAYGIAGTASLLDSRFSLQWRGRRTAVPRHQTLAAALDWSYDLLPPAESATLRRLSVFAGPFAPEAAAAVAVRRRPQRVRNAGSDRQPGHQIADLAVRLADAALSPARHHAHLCAWKAERARRSQAVRAASCRAFSRLLRARGGRYIDAAAGMAEHLWRGAGQCARRVGLGLRARRRRDTRDRADGGRGHAVGASVAVRRMPRAQPERRSPRSATPAATIAFACSSCRRSAGR